MSGLASPLLPGCDVNDAYSAYTRLGLPKDLTPPQIAHLSYLTRDVPEQNKTEKAAANGTMQVSIPMRSNDIVLVTVQRIYSGPGMQS